MARRYSYPLTVGDKLHFRLVLWWVKLTVWWHAPSEDDALPSSVKETTSPEAEAPCPPWA